LKSMDLKGRLKSLEDAAKAAQEEARQLQRGRSTLEGEVEELRSEVDQLKAIAMALVNKYIEVQDGAPDIWQEVEEKTIPR